MKQDLETGLISANISAKEINPDKAYALYLGKIRNIGMTQPLVEPLSRRYGKPVEIIHVLSALPPPYITEKNYVVINNELAGHTLRNPDEKFSLKISPGQLGEEAGQNPHFKEMMRAILKSQPDIVIDVFETTKEIEQMVNNSIVIAPNSKLAYTLDSKINQRKVMRTLGIPVPEGFTVNSFDELVEKYKLNFANSNGGGAYVCTERGSSGGGSDIIYSIDELLNSKKLKGKQRFTIMELLDLDLSITIQGVIANSEDVAILGVNDMIMDGVNYRGVIGPSLASSKNVTLMLDYTDNISKHFGSIGYRGYFNYDFMIDKLGRVYLTETNTRKGGSTLTNMMTHKVISSSLPSPSELEMNAVLDETFGDVDVTQYKLPTINFGLKSVKMDTGQRTGNYVPMTNSEVDLFRNSGVSVYDHPGKDVTYLNRNSVARVVVVSPESNGNTREDIMKRLELETSKIEII